MTTLIVIRHGQSVANEEDKFAGFSDFDLTALGKKQAELAASYIKERYTVDAVYASDLLRAYNTGLPTARAFGLEINKSEKLREVYAGRWESMKYSDISRAEGDIFQRWFNDYTNAYCPEGESVRDVCVRVWEETKEIVKKHEGQTVVIATHANPVWAIRELTQKENEVRTNNDLVANASISIIGYDNGEFFEIRSNITDHLGELVTALPELDKV